MGYYICVGSRIENRMKRINLCSMDLEIVLQNEIKSGQLAGVSLGLVQHGKCIYQKSLGFVNLETDIPSSYK